MLKWFFESNGWGGRLARTIVQAVIGFILAYVNDLVALLNLGDSTQALIVAAVMMLLSPIMQMIGERMQPLPAVGVHEAEGEKDV